MKMAPGRKTSTTRIKDEIAKLEARLKEAEGKEAERLGAIAVKAGLHELDVSEAEIFAAMTEVFGRFQTKNKPAPAAA
jgi:hypothetical protein